MRILQWVALAGLLTAGTNSLAFAHASGNLVPQDSVILVAQQRIAALPSETGNVGEGHKLAENVCAQCHAVEGANRHSPNPRAPSFPDIVASPGLTATAIRVWLQTPHPTMPNLMLNNEEKDSIVAYLLSLKAV